MPQLSGEPELKLARDEFTVGRRTLEGHPEAVAARATIDVKDFYGGVTTWVIDLFRLEGDVTAFIQVGRPDGGYVRLVMPSEVTAAIIRHQAGLITKARRKQAKKLIANRKAQGLPVGNPEALALARKKRRKK
jgi:hypothetical protein